MSGPRCGACAEPLRRSASFCSTCGAPAQAASAPQPAAAAGHSAVIRNQWAALLVGAWLYGVLLFASLGAGLVLRVAPSPWVVLWAQALDALVILGFARYCAGDLRPLLGPPRRPSRRAVLEILGVTLGVVAFLVVYFRGLAAWGVPFIDTQPAYIRSAANAWIVALTICVAPPIFEELAFRGVLQSRLQMFISPREALVVQGALFALWHLSPLIFVSHFAMGLYLGYLRKRTRSLYPGMLAHAAWNTLVLIRPF